MSAIAPHDIVGSRATMAVNVALVATEFIQMITEETGPADLMQLPAAGSFQAPVAPLNKMEATMDRLLGGGSEAYFERNPPVKDTVCVLVLPCSARQALELLGFGWDEEMGWEPIETTQADEQ